LPCVIREKAEQLGMEFSDEEIREITENVLEKLRKIRDETNEAKRTHSR